MLGPEVFNRSILGCWGGPHRTLKLLLFYAFSHLCTNAIVSWKFESLYFENFLLLIM